jgi:eukaryotic-like serine/threonine-protein kinase
MWYLGKYELIKDLGRGASSTVYLARDPYLQTDIALKVIEGLSKLKGAVDGKTAYQMFTTEYSLVGRLVHPYIATLLDAGVIDGKGYVAVEYVPGGTLIQFCKPGALLPVRTALEIVFKCSRALAYASQMGVLHRDIKPANILYCGGSNIKLTDFGSAVSTRLSTATAVIRNLGTPNYMAPERFENSLPTPKSDMYALGVVLYQLLTGMVPYRSENTAMLIEKIRNEPADAPSTMREEIPSVLDELVLRMLAKNPDSRYASWEDLSVALSNLLELIRVRLDTREFIETDKYGALRRCTFFASFTDAMLWELIAFSHWSRFAAGDTIMQAGAEAHEVCIVADGELTAQLSGHELSKIANGESFGELAYVLGESPRRAADIVAKSDGILIKIEFNALRQASPACQAAFNSRFLLSCANRLKTLTHTHFGAGVAAPMTS